MNNEEKILAMLAQMQADISGTKTDISGMQSNMTSMQSDMSTLKSDVSTLKSDMSNMQADISGINQRLTKMEIVQENVVEKKINLLIEGQKTILETLAPKSRVDDLEEEVKFLKSVVRQVCEDMQELKKAQ